MELLDEFVKRNPDVHEIFHEGYRRGVIEGFTTAAKKTAVINYEDNHRDTKRKVMVSEVKL